MPNKKELEDIEIRLLLEGIFQQYGWDLRDYAPASLKRRILKCVGEEKLKTVSALQDKVLHEAAAMRRLLDTISVDVTSMFRDPGFYLVFRQKVVPLLRGYSFVRIWHAGCATGEEVYSMAILLHEEGLSDKTRIYATDMNESLLEKSQEGIFPLGAMKEYTDNYIRAGGTGSFSDYYTAKYENVKFRPALTKNVVWARHNLATDASFNEFHVIVCRNVMIYFNESLQKRVHDLLYESLITGGVLGLGSKESITFTSHEKDYETLDERAKLYRKIK
jgi:chemotaxis protein methyltransferase CheR